MLRFFFWALALLSLSAIGCGDAPATEDAPIAEVAYLCSETEELIFAPAQAVPAKHPKTGRATLMRAGYCPKCKEWQALPPPEVYNGNPLGFPCPDHEIPLQPDGPRPE